MAKEKLSRTAAAKREWFEAQLERLTGEGLTKTQIASMLQWSPQRLTNLINGSDAISDKVIDNFVDTFGLGGVTLSSREGVSVNEESGKEGRAAEAEDPGDGKEADAAPSAAGTGGQPQRTLLYFAKRSHFASRRPGGEYRYSVLDCVKGVLEGADVRRGRSATGLWLVFTLDGADGERYQLFFETSGYEPAGLAAQMRGELGRRVMVGVRDGVPVVTRLEVEDGGAVRGKILDGLVAGLYDVDDLPALAAFSLGDDSLFGKWKLFRKEMESEGPAEYCRKLEERLEQRQERISALEKKNDELSALCAELESRRLDFLKRISDALTLLQGDEYLQGDETGSFGVCHSENCFFLEDSSYGKLAEAVEMLRPRKGIYVVCGDGVHRIHHAYIEDKGRVLLLGSSKPARRDAPEELREFVDRFYKASDPA